MNKTLLFISLILITYSCSENSDKQPNVDLIESTNTEEIETNLPYELYRSSESSFQANFFLKIEAEKSTIYGWEITPNNDTIYYRSECKSEESNHEEIRLRLEKYELTRIKLNENNLEEFIEDTTLETSAILFFHNSFFGKQSSDNLIQLQAVKHIYDSRADDFEFERIK